MKKCLDVETTERRVSTMSNLDGNFFHEQPMINVTEFTRDSSEESEISEVSEEESSHSQNLFVKAGKAAFAARKSIASFFNFKKNETEDCDSFRSSHS